jgi:D-serine/D-alanine/glycine transporter
MLLSNLEYKSFRDIAEDQLGHWAGFFSGWTYWLCWIVIGMADIAAVTNYALWWFPNMPKFVPAAVLVVMLFLLNIVAVRLFGEIEFWFALIKVVAVVSLIGVAIYMIIVGFHIDLKTLIGSQRLADPTANSDLIKQLTQDYQNGASASLGNLLNTSHGGFFPRGFSGFLSGFQIAFYAFLGIELVGTAAAETRDPEKSLPKAINAIPIRVVLFYVFSLAAILAVTPYVAIDPNYSPFVDMFALTGLAIAASVVNFVVLTSAASSMNSGIYSTSRMMFGLALTDLAPKTFARLSKSKVPAHALMFSCVCVLPGIALLYASGSIMTAFTYATSAANVLFIFVWSLIMFSYWQYRKNRARLHESSRYKMPIGLPMTWVVMGFFIVMLVILCMDKDTFIGAVSTVAWFVILTLVYRSRQNKAKNAVSA